MRTSQVGKHEQRVGRRGPWCGFVLLAAALLFPSGCKEETLRTFRDAAAAGLQTGVNSIMDGVVDGLFAALLGDAAASDSAGGTGTTTGQ